MTAIQAILPAETAVGLLDHCDINNNRRLRAHVWHAVATVLPLTIPWNVDPVMVNPVRRKVGLSNVVLDNVHGEIDVCQWLCVVKVGGGHLHVDIADAIKAVLNTTDCPFHASGVLGDHVTEIQPL